MYKIETHMHTKYSSGCGQLNEKELVEGYLAAGYAAVTVTDHYNRYNILDKGACKDYVKRFLDGYYRVKEEGERHGLRVYKGAEIRFDGSDNDYLLLNYRDELLKDPESFFTMGLEKFAPIYRADGALLIQAHPNRAGCSEADHRFLDGVEVLNMHPGHMHHNNNRKTLEYAQRWPELIRISGSDCHQTHHMAQGGIIASWLPENEAELVKLLRSKNYELIGSFDRK
jgi:predicted metal-dependent phosphoesterase TrpH